MRLLLELAVVAALVTLGWNKSFSERVGLASLSQAPAQPAARSASAVATAADGGAPARSPNGAWMWDPNRRATLDRPAYDSKQRQPWHTDESGRRYRVDDQGKRHYER